MVQDTEHALVQFYYPNALSKSRLDRYLASGWFRNGYMLFRSQIICLDGDVFSLVNIRLKLDTYDPPKRMKKILARGIRDFQVQFGKANINTEKERLYQQHKNRFKGFTYDSLEQFFSSDFFTKIFDTYEVCVYHHGKLVAVSFFDLGTNSIASLLGLYDQSYKKHSLGLFTMLQEIAFGQKEGFKYYYPGYILDKSSSFDYKLRLGPMQYYNWNGKWLNLEEKIYEGMISGQIKEKTAHIEEVLHKMKVPFQTYLYPFFSMGYLGFFGNDYMKSTVFIECFPDNARSPNEKIVLEYLVEQDIYSLALAEVTYEYYDMVNMQLTEEFLENPQYFLKMITYEEIWGQGKSVEDLVHLLVSIKRNRRQ